MREFFIILCLAFTQAERLGHSYGQGGSHNAFESKFRNRGHIASATSTANNHVSASELITFGTPPETNYEKEFYSYSAPEDDDKDSDAIQRLVSAMRSNLRVIFIKAPENNGLTNAVLQIAKQNAESKTSIYVLTKETDVGDLANKFQNIQKSKTSQPEVHFVKYRTPDEAVRAQQIIQNEYDALGGSSRVSKEQVAPVLDLASKKDEAVRDSNASNNIDSAGSFATPLNTYIPSKPRTK